MPLYTYRFSNEARLLPDGLSLELSNDEAALEEAHHIARDLQNAPGENWCEWVIEVTDQTGQRLIAIPVSDVPP